jgi:hypothetical protein
MKKIVTSQMPVAKIARPLLLGSLLISTAGVSVEAETDLQKMSGRVQSAIATALGAGTWSKGSVAGAKEWQPVISPPSTSSTSNENSGSYGCMQGNRNE